MNNGMVKATEPEECIAARIEQMERHYMVGRENEIRFFLQQLTAGGASKRILNLFGTGGVGKSYLLDEFRGLAEKAKATFLLMDSRGFSHTPNDFCTELLRMLGYPAEKPGQMAESPRLLELCRDMMREKAATAKLVLALDTFEEMNDMETWLREVFLPQLHPDILILVAGRFPLQGQWLSSPAWRHWIHRMPIGDLDFFSVKQYLDRSGISKESAIKQIWTRTGGHPLTLSLIVSTTMVQNIQGLAIADGAEVFEQVVKTWLTEVPNDELRELAETAAVLRHFNQELLSYVLDRAVATEVFQWLVGLSFVRRVDRGWILHDLMRDAIGHELRIRQPEHYSRLQKRCIMYYYGKMTHAPQRRKIAWEGVEWYYYIGDHVVRNFCYRKLSPYRMEALNSSNWTEAERYLEERRANPKEVCVPLPNPDTGELLEYAISREESLHTVKHIHLRELHELDSGIVKLMRDQQGNVCGLTAIVPIHAGTLDYLRTRPLSSAYFQSLPEHELKELRQADGHIAGYFVKTIDVVDFEDVTIRTTAGLTFISLLLSSDYVVASPPDLPFLKDFHLSLGCEQTRDIVHDDYDTGAPAPYYVLDTRGAKLQHYLNKMIESFGLSEPSEERTNDLPMLSARENEVANLLVQGRMNQEIAASLYVSEITVKKHLSAIYRKLGIRNRTQLVNRMLKNIQ